MAGTKPDDGNIAGGVYALPGGRCPPAAMGKYSDNCRFVQSVALVGRGYAQHHFLHIDRFALGECPDLTVVHGQDFIQ